MAEERRIAPVDAVPDGTMVFSVRDRDDGEEKEAILVGGDDGIAAWLNYCRHFTYIRLDKGSGAPMRDGEIVCTNHGAMFDVASGRCTVGPYEGAVLEPVDVAVADGAVYLTDPDYEFLDRGPIEDGDGDLSSTSNVEF